MPGPADVQTAGFTGITASNGPGSGAFSSVMASLSSDFANTVTGKPTASIVQSTQPTNSQSESTSSRSSISRNPLGTATATPETATNLPTTFSTSVTAPGSLSGSSTTSANPSGTASNAASNATSGTVTKQHECKSLSCSPGLQAAVAVPVVVAVLAIFALFFFCARKRRRRSPATTLVSEKTKPRKKWSRHLRVFSFDAEILMGGRFSSTNSLRSRETHSLRSGNSARGEPSLHSVEEVAPPYRDAVSHARPPTSHSRGANSPHSDQLPRPSSSATAPPPYGSVGAATAAATTIAAAGTAAVRPTTPTSNRNPFEDSVPVSPIEEGSPFNDPAEDEARTVSRPMLSRGSSRYQGGVLRDDLSAVSTLAEGSDAGSIREAQVAQVTRNVSVRTVENSRRSS